MEASGSSGTRNCVGCGRAIAWDANVCPYCGHDYRVQMAPAMAQPQISEGMKILFYILSFLIPIVGIIIGVVYYSKADPESKHVGKICLVLAVAEVVLTVSLAALLYVFVMGFGGTVDGNYTPAVTLFKSVVPYGVKFTFTAPSHEVAWSDISIILSDDSYSVSWHPSTQDLSSSVPATEFLSTMALGSLTVFCNVTDIAGNGLVNSNDYFTLTTTPSQTFSGFATYTVTILYEPTGSAMCQAYFTG